MTQPTPAPKRDETNAILIAFFIATVGLILTTVDHMRHPDHVTATVWQTTAVSHPTH